jgi:hypothetical protein
LAYEKLLNEAYQHKIYIYEEPMEPKIKGLYADHVIWINKNIDNTIEKACVLAEEIGHYHTTVGDILDQTKLANVKQEKLARKWASERLVTPAKLVKAFECGCRSRYEIAEILNITEEFLEQSLTFYREKYGTEILIDEKYTLYLDPLAVYKIIK